MHNEKRSNFKEKLRTIKLNKKVIFVLAAVVFLSTFAILFWNFVLLPNRQAENTLEQALYQEEPVVRGDIVVGLSESGSVVMENTSISLGFESTIVDTFTTAGSYVTAGDELLQINVEDFATLYEAKESELETAQLQLQQAQIDAGVQQSNANFEYNTSVQSGTNAAGNYSIQMAQLDSGYAVLQNEITTLEGQLANIQRQITNGLDNDYGLASYKSELETINTQIADVQAQISAGQAASQDTTSLQSNLAQLTLLQEETNVLISLAQADYDKALQELQTSLTTTQNSLTSKYNERDTYTLNMPIQQQEYASQYNASVHDSATAQSEYDSAMVQIETALTQAEQAVSVLEAEMEMFSSISEDGIITAPQDGYVMTISESDTLLTANTALITLADNAFVNLSVSIPQEDISDITIGMETNVLLDAYDDESLAATVESISIVPSGNMQSSTSYTVSVACNLANYPDLVVYEGMTAEVTFVQRQVEDVLIISNKCILSEEGGQFVQLLNSDGSIEKVAVETGFSDGFNVEVTNGLLEGDVVLIENVVAANENQ